MTVSPVDFQTKNYYEKLFYVIEKVEYYNAYSGHKKDFIGCIDFIAFNENETIGIQATTRQHEKERFDKIINNKKARLWTKVNKFHLITWEKDKSTGRFNHKILEITEEDFKTNEKNNSNINPVLE